VPTELGVEAMVRPAQLREAAQCLRVAAPTWDAHGDGSSGPLFVAAVLEASAAGNEHGLLGADMVAPTNDDALAAEQSSQESIAAAGDAQAKAFVDLLFDGPGSAEDAATAGPIRIQ
jgi:hypothetical protein